MNLKEYASTKLCPSRYDAYKGFYNFSIQTPYIQRFVYRLKKDNLFNLTDTHLKLYGIHVLNMKPIQLTNFRQIIMDIYRSSRSEDFIVVRPYIFKDVEFYMGYGYILEKSGEIIFYGDTKNEKVFINKKILLKEFNQNQLFKYINRYIITNECVDFNVEIFNYYTESTLLLTNHFYMQPSRNMLDVHVDNNLFFGILKNFINEDSLGLYR